MSGFINAIQTTASKISSVTQLPVEKFPKSELASVSNKTEGLPKKYIDAMRAIANQGKANIAINHKMMAEDSSKTLLEKRHKALPENTVKENPLYNPECASTADFERILVLEGIEEGGLTPEQAVIGAKVVSGATGEFAGKSAGESAQFFIDNGVSEFERKLDALAKRRQELNKAKDIGRRKDFMESAFRLLNNWQ